MSQTFLRFFEALPTAIAVGLLLLPLLIGESGARFKPAVAALASLRALLGFGLIVLIARAIIPADVELSFDKLVTFCLSTSVGRAWVATELSRCIFALAALARLRVESDLLDKTALGLGVLVLALTSVTGHAIDDSFSLVAAGKLPSAHGRGADVARGTSRPRLVDVHGARQSAGGRGASLRNAGRSSPRSRSCSS